MRPAQNNKRMRGRPNNNRKGPNPLTRSYELSGPDVKIRGTAHHISEKYLQLARDAQASGDPVMAESYLQHAEHYFRLDRRGSAGPATRARRLSSACPGKPSRKRPRTTAISAAFPTGSRPRLSVFFRRLQPNVAAQPQPGSRAAG